MLLPPIHDTPVTRLANSIDTSSRQRRIVSEQVNASDVPTEKQTTLGVDSLLSSPRISAEISGMALNQIRSVRQAPSAVITENFLAARALSMPGYVQNTASVRAERISNLYADVPRFRNQIDILA